MGAECVAHEAGEGKHEGNAETAVAELGGEEQEAEVADQGDDQARMRQIQRHRDAGGKRGKRQRHRQQHVGVLDDLVGRQRRGLATAEGGDLRIHVGS